MPVSVMMLAMHGEHLRDGALDLATFTSTCR